LNSHYALKKQGSQAKLCPVLWKCCCLRFNLRGRSEIQRAVTCVWTWGELQEDNAQVWVCC